MAIEKNSFKFVMGTRLDSESMSSEENDIQRLSVAESDDYGDEYEDYDSGAGSDDFNLLELGETGEEFCQIGDQTCCIPFELYDLSGLGDILSMDVWNNVLTDDERFGLAKYLPDMDQETFMRTMKELFTFCNFHFEVPISKLFDMLKGGLCEPRVALYRQGLGFFQKRHHYHVVRKHQNMMVDNLFHMKEAWMKCREYDIEEKLQVLNIMKSEKTLMCENMEEQETNSSDWEDYGNDFQSRKKLKGYKQKWARYPGFRSHPTFDLEPAIYRKENSKGSLKVLKISTTKEPEGRLPSKNHLEIKSGPHGSGLVLPKQARDKFRGEVDEEKEMYEVTVHRDQDLHSGLINKAGRKFERLTGEDYHETFMDTRAFGRNRTVNQLSDIKVLTAKPSDRSSTYGLGKKFKRTDNNQEIPSEDPMIYRKFRGPKLSQRDSQLDMNDGVHPPYKHVDWKLNNKNGMICRNPTNFNRKDDFLHVEHIKKQEKRTIVSMQNGGQVVAVAEGMKMLSNGEETESDSLERFSESDDDDPLIRSKWLYPSSVSGIKADFRKAKFGMKDTKNARVLDGLPQTSRKNDRSDGIYSVKAKQKVKTSGSGRLNSSNVGMHGLDSDNFAAKKGQMRKGYAYDRSETTEIKLSGCNSLFKKHLKEELMYIDEQEDHGYTIMDTTVEEDTCLENKTQKKPYTLITPTVHTGFSFSIIHLLSAVRMAMITLLPEDSLDLGKHHHINEEKQEGKKSNAPYLTVEEIVNRVKSNPGDPCILETQEPLHDLVRGVVKIFSSKSSPLGAKGWKPLVVYEKSIKSWSWIGPVSQSSSDHDAIEEVTSPESWGLSYKILIKLVDSFANWLKSGQETLQQIGSLPAPPLTLMQVNLDEKERFKDLKAQRSLNTINQSSKEVKDYFHKEEVLRYSIPDRSFAYTAVDGKKSTVAPLKKGAGKPTSKARDHFMLKRDRPPHVTVLCLVRDAAARLPGSIGTRADVCTLIRDSQYIVEDVSDSQVNQVVSGALDRLHYEQDPCVQFDGERKLWVYLHREREEEDFEDDATSSTKKWKRQKKESIESLDLDAVYHGTSEQTGLDFSSDLNLEPSGVDNDKKEHHESSGDKQMFVG